MINILLEYILSLFITSHYTSCELLGKTAHRKDFKHFKGLSQWQKGTGVLTLKLLFNTATLEFKYIYLGAPGWLCSKSMKLDLKVVSSSSMLGIETT